MFRLASSASRFQVWSISARIGDNAFANFSSFFFGLFACFKCCLFGAYEISASINCRLIRDRANCLAACKIGYEGGSYFQDIVCCSFCAYDDFRYASVASFAASGASFSFIEFGIRCNCEILGNYFHDCPLGELCRGTFYFFANYRLNVIRSVVSMKLHLYFNLFFREFCRTFFYFFNERAKGYFRLFCLLVLRFIRFFFLLVGGSRLNFRVFSCNIDFYFLTLGLFLALTRCRFTLFRFVFDLLGLLVALHCFFFRVYFFIRRFLLGFRRFIFLCRFHFNFHLFRSIVMFNL